MSAVFHIPSDRSRSTTFRGRRGLIGRWGSAPAALLIAGIAGLASNVAEAGMIVPAVAEVASGAVRFFDGTNLTSPDMDSCASASAEHDPERGPEGFRRLNAGHSLQTAADNPGCGTPSVPAGAGASGWLTAIHRWANAGRPAPDSARRVATEGNLTLPSPHPRELLDPPRTSG